MLLAAHSIAGGYLGSQVDSLPIAFIIGFISHFLLDIVPHYDTTDNGKFTSRQLFLLVLDGLIGLFILYHIDKISGMTNSYVIGIAGGLAPDLLDNVPFWRDRFRKSTFGKFFHRMHSLIHQKQPNFFLGYLTQILAVALFYFLSVYR